MSPGTAGAAPYASAPMIYDSASMQQISQYMQRAANSESTVLITGETGTGKELAAEFIHQRSRRSNKPFVWVNCAAIPDRLLESELFGRAKGAFTGAEAHREGLFAAANGGNLSAANQQTLDGEQVTLQEFAPVKVVGRQPSLAALSSRRKQLMDLSGDGQLDLVDLESPAPGFFEPTEDFDWERFKTFRSLPDLDWRNPNLRFIDLTGDGLPNRLISEDDAFCCWYTSRGADGFGPAQRVAQALDEEKGPKLIFADSAESIFLADMSGDALTDVVRIRNGEVCYWPNLGYGRFGAKVNMDQAPRFDRPELFNRRRIRLADIDGSGLKLGVGL